MPDIREPYPVKPVWPTRPGRKIADKKVPKDDQGKEKKKKQSDNSRPHIDDYA